MYGPSNPIKFPTTDITEKPVCLRQVGKISIACKWIAKNIIEVLKRTATAKVDDSME